MVYKLLYNKNLKQPIENWVKNKFGISPDNPKFKSIVDQVMDKLGTDPKVIFPNGYNICKN